MPTIECKDLKISYFHKKTGAEIPVFTNLNLQFENEKITVILGPSGCGKTTLLNVISGLYYSIEGQVLFDGVDDKELTIRDRDVSYVKQDLWLYPLKTIFDNIAFPLKFCDISQEEVYYRVREMAKKLDIEHCLTRRPKHISLGQQKRVALARAMIKEPSLVLFDEPLSALDPILKDDLLNLIKASVKEYKSTAIYVTHDYLEALKIADNIIYLGEDSVLFNGSLEDFVKPENELIKTLQESVSFVVK